MNPAYLMFRYTSLAMPYCGRFDSLNFGSKQELSRRISNIHSTDKMQDHLQHFLKLKYEQYAPHFVLWRPLSLNLCSCAKYNSGLMVIQQRYFLEHHEESYWYFYDYSLSRGSWRGPMITQQTFQLLVDLWILAPPSKQLVHVVDYDHGQGLSLPTDSFQSQAFLFAWDLPLWHLSRPFEWVLAAGCLPSKCFCCETFYCCPRFCERCYLHDLDFHDYLCL